jgi:hypothetical protein
MLINKKLHQAAIQAVKNSMLIEGYKTDRSEEVREKARLLMRQHHVVVSTPRK